MQAGKMVPVNIFAMGEQADVNLTAVVEAWLVPDHVAPPAKDSAITAAAQV
jgi:hypothetical protein